MRILLSSDAIGGLGIWASDLAHDLQQRGHCVHVASLGTSAWSGRLEWMDAAPTPRIESETAALRRQWAKFARAWRADIVHANHFSLIGAAPGVPNVLGIHSDVVSWWRHVRGQLPPPTPFQSRYRALALAALDHADAVVAPTHAAASDISVSFACRRMVQVIPNGCRAASGAHHAKQPFALAVGRAWDEGKQMSMLAACRHPIVILGERRHPATGSIPELSSNLQYLGHQPPATVRQWMARAQVFISPSRYEPFGLAALEAALAGCDLLLNDIPTYREIWGPTATYFTRNDPRALSASLDRLFTHPDPHRGAAARAHALLHLNPERMATHYERLYRRLLQRQCTYLTSPTPGSRTGTTATPTSSAAG